MSGNPNTNSGLSNREKWALEGKAKQGWKVYFIERERVYALQQQRNQYKQLVAELKSGIKPDISHLSNMFLELFAKCGEMCECPVCYEDLTKETTNVPICGHLVCKDCKSKMTECPLCKKKY